MGESVLVSQETLNRLGGQVQTLQESAADLVNRHQKAIETLDGVLTMAQQAQEQGVMLDPPDVLAKLLGYSRKVGV